MKNEFEYMTIEAGLKKQVVNKLRASFNSWKCEVCLFKRLVGCYGMNEWTEQ